MCQIRIQMHGEVKQVQAGWIHAHNYNLRDQNQMVGHKFVELVIQGIRMDKVDQYTTKKCQGFIISLLVPVSMPVLASSPFLRPLLSAASFVHQEHHESVQSEGPYYQNGKAWLAILAKVTLYSRN